MVPEQTTVQLTKSTTLTTNVGPGSGAVTFVTSTPLVCTVTSAGVLTALTSGTCLVTATKAASAGFSESSATVTIVISDSDLKAAEAKAKADAEAAAKAKAEADAKAAAEKVIADRIAAAEAKAAAVIVNPVVTRSGTKFTLDLPDKYYGKIATVYVGTTVKGKTTYKKLNFFVLAKQDATATFTSKVKLVKGQTVQVRVGSAVIKSVKIK